MTNVLEEFEDGPSQEPAEGLLFSTSDSKFIQLTPQDKVTLVQFYHTRAYAVVLKLMEGEITKAETEHFKKWRNKEEFERTGVFAVAMRTFYERIQTEINRQVEEFAGEVEFAKVKKQELLTSPEEQIIKSFQ